MEVPRLGVKFELQLPAYAIATAIPDLSPTEQGHRSTLNPDGYWLGLLSLSHDGNSLYVLIIINLC